LDIVGTSSLQLFTGRDGAEAALTWSPSTGKVIRDSDAGHFLDGSDGDDTIYGNGGNDNIEGSFGHDIIYGGNGNDHIDGGFDNDRLYGGGGRDWIEGGWDNDHLEGGSGDDQLLGFGDSDTLYGGSGADTISGDSGSDLIVGSAGNDMISTGSGKDILIFKSALNAATNIDTVLDYKPAYDTMRLENTYFKQLTRTGTLSSTAFRVGPEALDRSDRIIYDNTTGALFYDPDGNGPAAAIQFAKMINMPVLRYSEFIVV
jgi:Ca2+-binding RTX toxin-like protein